MKNLNYFPFERNRYFYGKLLTVSDFQVEQKYVNDKRRLINRFLYGSGVVCGLNVTQADDTTVLVEMGLALDFSGREIVVDAPVINKLSMLEGFESASEAEGDADYLYLCLEYAEKEKEAVHNITDAGTSSTPDTEYNKFAESYRLFLTGQEPENEGITPEQFYLDTKTVYWGNGLRIKQVLPKYTQADGETELKIIVENMGQQQPFGFSYDLDMVCLQGNGQNRMTVSFDEKDFDKGVRYEFSYPLKALAVKETVGTVTVAAESISLTIGARELSERVRCVNVTNITEQNAKQKLMENYYRSGMDDIVKNNYQQSIYLAKIGITKTGPAYVIKSVENMPFNQYVFNNSLAAAINDMEIRGIEGYRTTTEGNSFDKDRSSSARGNANSNTIATGQITLDLGAGGLAGQLFYSQEITHGLGLGPVYIVLGESYSTNADSELVFGESEIFKESRDMTLTRVQLAAKADTARGTFIIGARITEPTSARTLNVNWLVIRDNKENNRDLETKRIFIKPDMANVDVRESCYFEAIFTNTADKRVKWKVKEADGGTINSNGMYTAPNQPGVYEIIAESVANPEQKATTYVVVRNN